MRPTRGPPEVWGWDAGAGLSLRNVAGRSEGQSRGWDRPTIVRFALTVESVRAMRQSIGMPAMGRRALSRGGRGGSPCGWIVRRRG